MPISYSPSVFYWEHFVSRKRERATQKAAAQEHARARRSLTLRVYDDIDLLTSDEVSKMNAAGRAPTCRKGCSHCCRQQIRVPRAEAEVIVEWLLRDAVYLVNNLKTRLASWLAWYRTEYPKLLASDVDPADAFYSYGPQCPALVDDACSIYPVRPVVCRTHFVTSPPDACRPSGDPAYLDESTKPVIDLLLKTAPIAKQLRTLIESQGASFKGTVHLLPEWMAHLLEVEDQPWRTMPPLDLSDLG